MRRVATAIAALLAASAGLVFVAPSAHAANPDIVVTTSVDVVDPVDGLVSLREAVSLANVTVGANTVVLTAGTTYPLTICDGLPSEEDTNASGDLDATNPAGLTINGNGATIVAACPAADQERILHGLGGPLILTWVTVRGGHGVAGGALQGGDMALGWTTVTGNTVTGEGYGFPQRAAVRSFGAVDINASSVEWTSAGSGLVAASAIVTNSSIVANAARPEDGMSGVGGLIVTTATVTGSTISDNSGAFGGMLVDTATVADSRIERNVSAPTSQILALGTGIGGKTIHLTRVAVNANVALPTGPVQATGGVGALHLVVDDSAITDNQGLIGGVLSSDLMITDSRIDGNTSTSTSHSEVGGVNGAGTITDSSITNNRGGSTGGVVVDGSTPNPSLTLLRSVVTGNQGQQGAGGISPHVPLVGVTTAQLVLRESAVVGNAGTLANELGATPPAVMDVASRSSVIGVPSAVPNCDLSHVTVVSEGNNWDSDGSCGLTASSDTSAGGDPLLGPLGPHGGAVDSMVPLPGSPLVDRIPPGTPGCSGEDVNAVAVPQGPGCDIGASESLAPSSRYHPVTPVRVLDTRTGLGFGGRLGQTPRTLAIGGASGVPLWASAVVMNVTATDSTAGSYLSVWGAGRPAPTSASVNFGAHQTRNNLTTVRLGRGAAVELLSAVGDTDVVADVVGWYGPDAGDGFTATGPTRILDSRTGEGFSGAVGQTPKDLTVTNVGGVPADATAVALNVTVTQSTAASFLTVWPTGQPRPLASSSNFAAGETLDLAVVAKVGAGGKVSFYSGNGSTQVVADVVGYYTASGGAAFHPVPPTRIADSRSNTGITGPVGNAAADLQTAANQTLMGQSPGPATGVVANVAITQGSTASWLTAWPSGQTKPLAANLVYGPGQTLNNLGFLAPGTGGTTSFATGAGTTQVIADAAGWFGA